MGTKKNQYFSAPLIALLAMKEFNIVTLTQTSTVPVNFITNPRSHIFANNPMQPVNLLMKRFTRVRFPVESYQKLLKSVFTAFLFDVPHLKGTV